MVVKAPVAIWKRKGMWNLNLYELTDAYLQLQELMEDPEVDAQVIADTMEHLADKYPEVTEGEVREIFEKIQMIGFNVQN